MELISDEKKIFNFIIRALEIAAAPYQIINNELIMAQCQVWVPANFFRPARNEVLNLQMVCQPEYLSKYPGAELVTKDSFRLQWLIEGVQKRGLVAKGFYDYHFIPEKHAFELKNLLRQSGQTSAFNLKTSALQFLPHLMVNFLVTQKSDQKEDYLHSLSINLVTGRIVTNLIPAVRDKIRDLQNQKLNLAKRTISYRDGFGALLNHLKWRLFHNDRSWAEAAQKRFLEEIKALEEYYSVNEKSPAADWQSFYRHAAELYKNVAPTINIKIVNTGILYLPLIISEINYLGSNELPQTVFLDPLFEKLAFSR